jgi:hypothetical protein
MKLLNTPICLLCPAFFLYPVGVLSQGFRRRPEAMADERLTVTASDEAEM